jgi:hypothetical protein
MTDFGRKDFGNALKMFFEEDGVAPVDPYAHIDKFKATDPEARSANNLGKEGASKISADVKDKMQNFVEGWNKFVKTLKTETNKAIKSLELYAAHNTSVASDIETTDDQAATAAFGGTKADMAARRAAAAAAPAVRKMHGDKISGLSTDDFAAPTDLQGQLYGPGKEQSRLASMPGATLPGDKRGDLRMTQAMKRKKRLAAQAPAAENTLSDFSNMLMEVVERMSDMQEAKAPKVSSPLHMSPEERGASKTKPEKPTGRPSSLKEMIKSLRDFALLVDKQVQILDTSLKETQKLMLLAQNKMSKTFDGLNNLSDEQREHIMQVTRETNERLDKLKKDMEPLLKMKDVGSISELVKKVKNLEEELSAKQDEMDSQEQEYEKLLDYYEDIMIDMKKAELEAKRELRNLEAEMAGGLTSSDFAHTEPKGKRLTEEVQKPRKKKKQSPDFQHYGSFDLNEHLEKTREKLPKAKGDW